MAVRIRVNLARSGVGASRLQTAWGDWPAGAHVGYLPAMPFKHNAGRRHRIPKARYRIRNWPAYEAGLKRRGDLILWIDEMAVAGWVAPRRESPGGQGSTRTWRSSWC